MDDIPLGVCVQTEVEPVVGKSATVSSKEGGRVRPCSMFLLPRGKSLRIGTTWKAWVHSAGSQQRDEVPAGNRGSKPGQLGRLRRQRENRIAIWWCPTRTHTRPTRFCIYGETVIFWLLLLKLQHHTLWMPHSAKKWLAFCAGGKALLEKDKETVLWAEKEGVLMSSEDRKQSQSYCLFCDQKDRKMEWEMTLHWIIG